LWNIRKSSPGTGCSTRQTPGAVGYLFNREANSVESASGLPHRARQFVQPNFPRDPAIRRPCEQGGFSKSSVYNNCGGERYAHFIDNIGSTVFRDIPKSELKRSTIICSITPARQTWRSWPPLDSRPIYVARETQRAVAGVQGKCKFSQAFDSAFQLEKKAAKPPPKILMQQRPRPLRAGSDGVIFSRKYSKLQLANLSAAGRAVREAKG